MFGHFWVATLYRLWLEEFQPSLEFASESSVANPSGSSGSVLVPWHRFQFLSLSFDLFTFIKILMR